MRYLLLLLSLLPLAVAAQITAPAWSGVTTIGSSYVAPQTTATDALGNFYVGSSFYNSITLGAGTTFTSQGNQDAYVAKYSPAGTLMWARQLSGPGQQTCQALLLDAAGNVAMLAGISDGTTQLGSLTIAPTSSYFYAVALARLDAQGQPLTLTELGRGIISGSNYGSLYGSSLACDPTDPTGDYYFSGTFRNTILMGGTSLDAHDPGGVLSNDQFLAKVSTTGVLRWAQQGGRIFLPTQSYPLNESPQLVGTVGGFYFVWACAYLTNSFPNVVAPATRPGDTDLFAVRYNSQGQPQWVRWVGTAEADSFSNSRLDALGRLIVTGHIRRAGYYNYAPSSSASTGFVTVLEPTAGNLVWSAQLARTDNGRFSDVVSDAAGNLYAAGSFAGQTSLAGTLLTAVGSSDALVASFTPAGALRWTQQSSGTGYEDLYAICYGAGQLHVTGLINGAAQFGSISLMASYTPFLAHLGSVATAVRTAQAATPLALYPNPAASTMSVNLPTLPTGSKLTVRDNLSRVVRQQEASARLPLAGLAPGLYVVQALAPSGEQWQSKLVVE